jgi:hypothetical protein
VPRGHAGTVVHFADHRVGAEVDDAKRGVVHEPGLLVEIGHKQHVVAFAQCELGGRCGVVVVQALHLVVAERGEERTLHRVVEIGARVDVRLVVGVVRAHDRGAVVVA